MADAPPQAAGPHTIWREGDRIRATNGMGYADFVPDEQIREHIAHPGRLGGAEMIAFAEAVLAIRAYERLVAERRLRDAVGVGHTAGAPATQGAADA